MRWSWYFQHFKLSRKNSGPETIPKEISDINEFWLSSSCRLLCCKNNGFIWVQYSEHLFGAIFEHLPNAFITDLVLVSIKSDLVRLMSTIPFLYVLYKQKKWPSHINIGVSITFNKYVQYFVLFILILLCTFYGFYIN